MCSCDSDFRFDLASWQKAIAPITAPDVQSLVLACDPSFTAHDTSDASGVAVGFLGEESDLNVLHCEAAHLKGLALPDRLVSLCEEWKPSLIRIEWSPFWDLLHDTILLRAGMREVRVPQIVSVRVTTPKRHRIRRLQGLLDKNLLHIHNGSFVGALLEEAESFCFTKEDNHRRSDNRLDSLCLLANFR